MHKPILSALAIVALVFATVSLTATPAKAEHRRPPSYCPTYGGYSPYAASRSYRYSPYSVQRYKTYRASPYQPYNYGGHSHIHSYRSGYGHSPYYGGSSIGLHGRNFSFHLGF